MTSTVRRTILAAICCGVCAASTAAEHEVSQKDRQFSPSVLTIKVGESLNFKNDDTVHHSVFSLSKALSFDLGSMAPGQSSKVQATQEGVVEVECAVHPRMKLQIRVVK
jgi:plastocyanin